MSRVGIAAVDLHFKIFEFPDASFIDTRLPATYVAPATHLLGHPGVVVATSATINFIVFHASGSGLGSPMAVKMFVKPSASI